MPFQDHATRAVLIVSDCQLVPNWSCNWLAWIGIPQWLREGVGVCCVFSLRRSSCHAIMWHTDNDLPGQLHGLFRTLKSVTLVSGVNRSLIHSMSLFVTPNLKWVHTQTEVPGLWLTLNNTCGLFIFNTHNYRQQNSPQALDTQAEFDTEIKKHIPLYVESMFSNVGSILIWLQVSRRHTGI